ncbi:MOB kinase activator-like 2 isoform X2 [Condylostylus longicornis]|uniref:MOB kinase activator-like 2 isoform X2 n=1 Tax=Condylostylus longicornis TaxID=2530218 RepID=UPI00244DB105|nr:MOB kinase activator-like 2 isoform X2 [Condylostylus longicornis]
MNCFYAEGSDNFDLSFQRAITKLKNLIWSRFRLTLLKARRKERDGDQSSTDTKLYLEESVLERKLPDADLKALVDLPAGLDYNEWLASHTLALFEHVNLVYGTISEFCTTSGCQDMTGPGNRTYLWFDEKGKKTRVAAPQYIDYVMTFTQKTVSDESIFPTKYANEFPSSFESIARKILRLQFHVIAHLYAAHFKEIALLGLHTHLNLTFAHLTALHRRFNLIDEKETDVLRDLEVALRLTDEFSNNSGGSGTSSGGGAGNNSTTSSSTNGSNNSTINSSNNHHQGSGGAGIGGDHHNHHQQHRLLLGGTNDDNNLLNSGIAGRIDVVSSNINTNNILGNSGHSGLVGGGLIGVDITTSSSANASPRHPICTQPEAMKGLNSDQSDIRGGAGGGNCTDGSTYFKGGHSHQQVINFNNNHHNNSTGASAYTANSMLQQQCNNSRSSQNNSNNSPHTTTTA